MIDKRIKFDGKYLDKENKTVTYYFVAPKEMMSNFGITCPDAVSVEISVEFPLNRIEGGCCECSVSPSVIKDGVCIGVGWQDIYLPCEYVDELIDLANEQVKFIAEGIYAKLSDMDYLDYADTQAEDYKLLMKDLELLELQGNGSLLNALKLVLESDVEIKKQQQNKQEKNCFAK